MAKKAAQSTNTTDSAADSGKPPQTTSGAAPCAEEPRSPATKAKAPPSAPELEKPVVQEAIAAGRKVIGEGGTKADAARTMYETISGETKETIVAAFVRGATLTEKGALTYWYNCKRKASKKAPAAAN